MYLYKDEDKTFEINGYVMMWKIFLKCLSNGVIFIYLFYFIYLFIYFKYLFIWFYKLYISRETAISRNPL